jgi:hypothetical protein
VSTIAFPAFILIPSASAQSTNSTTFYFTKYGFDFDLFGSSTPVSQSYPTSTNLSSLPPQLTNTDDFVNWILLWGLVKTSDALLIKESYTYQGKDPVSVQGDAYFTLFFNSYIKRRLPRFQDSIELQISHEGNIVGNKTLTIEPDRLEGIVKKEYKKIVKINDLDFTLQTGDRLSFSLELILTNKTLPNIIRAIPDTGLIRNIIKPFTNFFIQLINNSQQEKLKNLLELKDQALEILSEFNITKDDIADLINDALPIHAYFVFDSPDYPSSVTIPAQLKDSPITTYYLHSSNELSSEYPSADQKTFHKLTDGAITFESTSLPRNKILTLNNATLNLYLSRIALPVLDSLLTKTIKATLIAGNETLATTTQNIETQKPVSTILSFRDWYLGPRTPITFTFSGESKEILYDTPLSIQIQIDGGRGILTRPRLFYGTTNFPSSLQLTLAETNNINMTVESDPTDEQIVPGDSIIYNLSITSKYADTVTINTTTLEETGEWGISVTPQTLNINEDSSKTATLTLTSLSNTKESYGDFLSIRINAEGKTGSASYDTFAEISENAISYKVSIPSYTDTKKIKKGTNGTFNFIIKNENTGANDDTDTYTIIVTSENNWNLQYINKYRNLKRGTSTGSKDIPVILSVPRNTSLESDTLTFTVSSDGSGSSVTETVTVTVEVLSLSFFETIYDAFESAAQTIGLDDALGEYAPLGLATILLIIILIMIIILMLIFTKKLFSIYCSEPIQDIDPNDHAQFTINIRNHSKKAQTFNITTPTTNPHLKWQTTIKPKTITIPGTTSDTIQILVTPTEQIKPKDWVEIPITVNIHKKHKTIRLSTMVSVKEGKSLLRITDAFTWPKEPAKGDRVITSFKIQNIGTLTAPNITILFFLNGRQKNKVKVTIPSGSYADIKIPWTAVKGKNKILIKAVEKKN